MGPFKHGSALNPHSFSLNSQSPVLQLDWNVTRLGAFMPHSHSRYPPPTTPRAVTPLLAEACILLPNGPCLGLDSALVFLQAVSSGVTQILCQLHIYYSPNWCRGLCGCAAALQINQPELFSLQPLRPIEHLSLVLHYSVLPQRAWEKNRGHPWCLEHDLDFSQKTVQYLELSWWACKHIRLCSDAGGYIFSKGSFFVVMIFWFLIFSICPIEK